MSNSFSYNSTDCGGSTYGVTVLESDICMLSQPNTSIVPVALSFGGVSRGNGYQPLSIALKVVVTGSSASDFMSKMDALKYLLDPRNGEKKLALDYITDRYWYAILNSKIDVPGPGIYHKQFDLEFIAADSRAYSTTNRTSPDFTISSSPQTLTVESGPTAVAGTAPADPVWTIKNTSGGTITTLTLNNTTTSESTTWVGSLANGNWLRITVATGLVEKSTDSGATWATAMTLTGSFTLPTLAGGVANIVTLTGLSSGTVVLAYTARYL